MKTVEYDLIAIGGGTAGLVSAAGASYLGARAGLVEREALGGDCLWTGCIPSKALIASARLAQAMRRAPALGLEGAAPAAAFRRVMTRMREARQRVAEHDDPERFRRLGVGVHYGHARFRDPRTVEVEGVGFIRARRIILATGASPSVPPIPGLVAAGHLTHRSAFELEHLPRSLLVLGAGPVGLELAQAYSRLGAGVTVVEMLPQILPREDPDVAHGLREALEEEGIRIHTGVRVVRVEAGPAGKRLLLEDGRAFEGEEILVATGRRPATGGLELERAGIEVEGDAVHVDARLRTTARGVWAAGDVTGGLQFTHVADYMARVALQNALFPLKKRVSYRNVPRVTYTDPEVAHVGLGETEARDRGATPYVYPFAELDRAIVDGSPKGFVKITADRRGRILGASILGEGAGELILPLLLARQEGISLPKLSATIFPYPTRVEGVKRAADAFQRARLEGRTGRVLRTLVSWLR